MLEKLGWIGLDWIAANCDVIFYVIDGASKFV